MNLRLVRCVVVLFTIALIARPAQAQGKRESGQKLTEQGRRAYNLGHWSDALTDFEKAYEVSGNPALLFNLAETHRELGHTADALRLYNAYLRELPNGPDHEAAATAIKNLGGTTAAKSPPAPPPKPATAPPPAPSPPPVATAPAKTTTATPAAAKPASPPPPVATAPARPATPAAAKPASPPPAVATAPAKTTTATPAAPPPPVATAPARSTPPPPAPSAASSSAPAPIVTIAPAPTGASVPPAATLPAAGPPTLVGQAPPPAAHRSRWPAIVGGAATGALAVGAIAFTVSGNHLYDDLKGSCGNTTTGCTQGQIDSVKTRDHAATAFWILAGVAAVATSVVLVVRF